MAIEATVIAQGVPEVGAEISADTFSKNCYTESFCSYK